ncbi:electron transfer flavoprotein, alpha subunit/FixB family protein, partial [human gut metagenome]
CAARLHTGLTADCTHLDVDVAKYKDFLRTTSTIDVDNTKFEENTNLKMTRPAFGGHLMATIICPRFRPQMSTVRPGVMQTQPFDEAGAAKVVVEKVTPALTADDIHVEILDIKKSAKKLVDLIGADVVVSVGRGISSDPEKGIALAEELAGALGGVVGASVPLPMKAGCLLTIRSARPARTVHPALY